MHTHSVFWPEEFDGQRSLLGYSPRSQLQRTGHNSVLGFPGGSDSLLAVWETQVLSLGRDDPLEKEMVTHSSILAWQAAVHGVSKRQTRLSDFTFFH